MDNVTTTFSEQELADFGRAMERNGFTDLKSFLSWAAKQQMQAILSAKTPNHTENNESK